RPSLSREPSFATLPQLAERLVGPLRRRFLMDHQPQRLNHRHRMRVPPHTSAEVDSPSAFLYGIVSQIQTVERLVDSFGRLTARNDHGNATGLHYALEAGAAVVGLYQICSMCDQDRPGARQEIRILLEITERVAHCDHAQHRQADLARMS